MSKFLSSANGFLQYINPKMGVGKCYYIVDQSDKSFDQNFHENIGFEKFVSQRRIVHI
jgi:hypothetical protein